MKILKKLICGFLLTSASVGLASGGAIIGVGKTIEGSGGGVIGNVEEIEVGLMQDLYDHFDAEYLELRTKRIVPLFRFETVGGQLGLVVQSSEGLRTLLEKPE